jgi:hypothetical protein
MAGSFEHINNLEDFRREVDRARCLCAEFIKKKDADPTLLTVDKQLEYIQGVLKAGRKPTRDERRSYDMGFRMNRRWEEIHDDVEFWKFKELISLLNLYIEYWPTDKLASDPKNRKKIDWLMEL